MAGKKQNVRLIPYVNCFRLNMYDNTTSPKLFLIYHYIFLCQLGNLFTKHFQKLKKINTAGHAFWHVFYVQLTCI